LLLVPHHPLLQLGDLHRCAVTVRCACSACSAARGLRASSSRASCRVSSESHVLLERGSRSWARSGRSRLARHSASFFRLADRRRIHAPRCSSPPP
jgi:hypothetical protein